MDRIKLKRNRDRPTAPTQVKYEVHIRCNETGEVRVYRTDTGINPWTGSEIYDWEQGNHSCDCNRGACFERAADPDDWDFHDCGETAFDVLKIVLEDGREFTIER